jgi:hypothetical protein
VSSSLFCERKAFACVSGANFFLFHFSLRVLFKLWPTKTTTTTTAETSGKKISLQRNGSFA